MWWLTAALVSLVCLFLLRYLLQKKKGGDKTKPIENNKIPGLKPSDPEEGNNAEIAKASDGTPFITPFLTELHRQFGPIASFWEGKKFVVSLASPDLLKAVRLVNVVDTQVFEPFREMIGDEALTYVGSEEGMRRRRLYEPYFQLKSIKHFFECFLNVTEETLSDWRRLTADDHVPLMKTMMAASMKIILRTSFGNYFKDPKHLNDFQTKIDHCSLYSYGKRSAKDDDEANVFKREIEEVRSVLREIGESRRKERSDDDQEPMLVDVMLRSEISEEQRICDSMGIILGAYNDVGNVMSFMLYELAKNPDIQEKVFREVVSVLGENRHATPEDVTKLVYLRQVLDEVMRCDFHADYVGRILEDEMEIGGYTVPSGTSIYIVMDIVFHDPKFWANPDKFDPEHFSAANTKTRHPYAFKPFGCAGKRTCPGYRFAYTECTVLVAEFCRQFRFHLVPGQTVTRFSEEIWVTLEKRTK